MEVFNEMVYLLGGAPRAGKTIIARRFLMRNRTPFFSLDYLMIALANGLPDLGIDPTSDELDQGERIWSVVEPLIAELVYAHDYGVDYLIEGAQLVPRYVSKFADNFGKKVKICFVGFTETTVEEKINQFRKHGGNPEEWMKRDYDGLVSETERLIAFSHRIKAECERRQLRFFESSTDLEKTIHEVLNYLSGTH
jgi:hypothetical protein